MNTSEKIDKALNPAILCLHKEGIFYKLYNQHAMLFIQNIKPLKITVKFIKTVNQHVYSAGFPVSLIDTVKKQLSDLGGSIEESEKMVVCTGVNWEKENDYMQWCEQQKEVESTRKSGNTNMTNVEKQIVSFQVMRKTPLEAMNFIVELQGQLNKANDC